jgi:hypothetical protein
MHSNSTGDVPRSVRTTGRVLSGLASHTLFPLYVGALV